MKELMDVGATSAYLRVAEQTLANWRWQGRGPRWYRVGGTVRYAREDLDAWLDQQLQDPAEHRGEAA